MGDLIRDLDQDFLTLNEVGKILRLSKMTVLNFINDGLLARVKLGRRVFVHIDDLIKFVEERHQTLKPKEGEGKR